MAKGGLPIGVDAHDEEGDEDHTDTGVDEEVGPSPVIGQGSQDLWEGAEIMLGRLEVGGVTPWCSKRSSKEEETRWCKDQLLREPSLGCAGEQPHTG